MFANVDELKKMLTELGYNETVVFDNPTYLDAIIGISDSGSLCYSYEKMIQHLMDTDKMEYEDAMEFVDYNTIRALPYASTMGARPIIVYNDFIK